MSAADNISRQVGPISDLTKYLMFLFITKALMRMCGTQADLRFCWSHTIKLRYIHLQTCGLCHAHLKVFTVFIKMGGKCYVSYINNKVRSAGRYIHTMNHLIRSQHVLVYKT